MAGGRPDRDDGASPAIRLATGLDAAAAAEIYRASVETSPSTFEVQAPTAAEMGRRIQETLAFYPWLVAELDGGVAGYAYATRHRARSGYQWSAETSVYVRESMRRRGVGRALYAALIRVLTAQGLFNAYAGITLPNPASTALHESVGFRPFAVYRKVGYKLGAWHDVGWWHLVLQPHRPEPPPPTGLGEIRNTADWAWLLEGR